jgi:hypothetical protein
MSLVMTVQRPESVTGHKCTNHDGFHQVVPEQQMVETIKNRTAKVQLDHMTRHLQHSSTVRVKLPSPDQPEPPRQSCGLTPQALQEGLPSLGVCDQGF